MIWLNGRRLLGQLASLTITGRRNSRSTSVILRPVSGFLLILLIVGAWLVGVAIGQGVAVGIGVAVA